jgi:hypothetical protein
MNAKANLLGFKSFWVQCVPPPSHDQ